MTTQAQQTVAQIKAGDVLLLEGETTYEVSDNIGTHIECVDEFGNDEVLSVEWLTILRKNYDLLINGQ